MRLYLFATALSCAPVILQAAPAASKGLLPGPDANERRGRIFPVLPDVPRGYTWLDCPRTDEPSVVGDTLLNGDGWIKRDLSVRGAPQRRDHPVVRYPPISTDNETDDGDPKAADKSNPPPLAHDNRSHLEERRPMSCGVIGVLAFDSLPVLVGVTLEFEVQLGQNYAFALTSNVVIETIQVLVLNEADEDAQYAYGPIVHPNTQTGVLNWHANVNGRIFFAVEFIHAGATGVGRLIQSDPVP